MQAVILKSVKLDNQYRL